MKRTAAICMGLALLASLTEVRAEVVQGQLELAWGDPAPVPHQGGRTARFVATLVADDGSRRVLDGEQARRAAVDLYALANRRVAVAFSTPRRGAGTRIEAIVAADRTGLPVSSKALMAPAAVEGTTRWISIACKFSDITDEQKAVDFFSGQYGNNPGQLGHYWQEVSYGRINLAGSSAHGWFTLPQPRSHYVTTVDGKEKANLDQLFDDCTAAANPTVNFAGAQGINMMFNGDLDGYAWGGGRYAALDGAARGWSTTWNPPWAFNNLAPLAHEMGHGYGLPHSDNSDGDSDTYDNPWDLMSDAWSNASSTPTYGTLPKHINMVQRDRLGWVDPARQVSFGAGSTVRELRLDRASLAGSGNLQMIILYSSTADSRGIYTYSVEARKTSGTYEGQLAGNAVIIHAIATSTDHLDTIRRGVAYSVDAEVPPANRSNNEGSMFKVGETWTSPDGSQKLRVVAATAEGFIVSIGNPRQTGGTQAPRTRPAAAGAQPARAATRVRSLGGHRCADPPVSAGCGRPVR